VERTENWIVKVAHVFYVENVVIGIMLMIYEIGNGFVIIKNGKITIGNIGVKIEFGNIFIVVMVQHAAYHLLLFIFLLLVYVRIMLKVFF